MNVKDSRRAPPSIFQHEIKKKIPANDSQEVEENFQNSS